MPSAVSDRMRANRVLVAKRPVVHSLEPRRSECTCTRSDDCLLFDCRRCSQGKDLNDTVCLKRVISALADEQDVKEIVLSGDWESIYREGCVRALNAYAELVRTCKSSGLSSQNGEWCRSCPNEPRRLISAIADRTPMPWDDLRRQAVSVTVRPGCHACTASTASLMNRLEAIAKGIDKTVAKEAFRIVGVSE
jgi:hypothetical protein